MDTLYFQHLRNKIRLVHCSTQVTQQTMTEDDMFLPPKQCFHNPLPKVVNTCFRSILLLITHAVGGICGSSRRKN